MNNYDKYYKELLYKGGNIWEVDCTDYELKCNNCILSRVNRNDNYWCPSSKKANIKILKEHFNDTY